MARAPKSAINSNKLFAALSVSASHLQSGRSLFPVAPETGQSQKQDLDPAGLSPVLSPRGCTDRLPLTSVFYPEISFATSNSLYREWLFRQWGGPFPEISQNKEKMVDIQKVSYGMEKMVEKLKGYPYKMGKELDFFLASVLQCIP